MYKVYYSVGRPRVLRVALFAANFMTVDYTSLGDSGYVNAPGRSVSATFCASTQQTNRYSQYANATARIFTADQFFLFVPYAQSASTLCDLG